MQELRTGGPRLRLMMESLRRKSTPSKAAISRGVSRRISPRPQSIKSLTKPVLEKGLFQDWD